MKRIFPSLGIAGLLFSGLVTITSLSSCNPSGTKEGTDTTATDTTIFDPQADCANLGPKQYCWAGLDFIQLGDTLTWGNFAQPEGGTFKDTVLSDIVMTEAGPDTTDWFTKMVIFPSGRVYLEADFETGHLLNRIRIETPEYASKHGIRIGSTVADIQQAYPDSEIHVLPFEAFGVMEIIHPVLADSAMGRKTVMHIPLGEWHKEGQLEYTLEMLPPHEKVVRIVLM